MTGTVRWFGEPWPSATERAPVCESDETRIPIPLGEECRSCDRHFVREDRGVSIPRLGEWARDPFHLDCFLAMLGLGPASTKIEG